MKKVVVRDDDIIHHSYHLFYCSVLYRTVLYCTILYCTVLFCTLLSSPLLSHPLPSTPPTKSYRVSRSNPESCSDSHEDEFKSEWTHLTIEEIILKNVVESN